MVPTSKSILARRYTEKYEEGCTLDLYWKVTRLDAIYSAGELSVSTPRGPKLKIHGSFVTQYNSFYMQARQRIEHR